MASRAMLILYTILIVVLVLILFLFVLALVLFRESLESCCCLGFSRRRGARRPLTRDPAGRREPSGGLQNPGYNELERPRRLPEQRPFDPMEQVESPPSYDEAVKQELFRFRPPPTTPTDRSNTPTEGTISEEDDSQTTNPPEAEESASACADGVSCAPPSLPSTSHSCAQSCRQKGSVITSGIASQLSTISEEDHEDWPVTVVIDCIGVQASRLLENCDTTVSLTNGSELDAHSKC